MRSILHLSVVLLFSSALHAELPKESGHGIEFLPKDRSAPIDKGMDDEEILEQRKAVKSGGFRPEGSERKGWGLLENSDFLSMDGHYVILPKNSVVFVPESRKENILSKPEGKMLTWLEFQTRFRALVYPIEVTMKEVSGEEPIAPEKLEAADRSNRIVVAVLSQNPVSVIPAKESKESTAP
ncbi:MAG: hypothetical protein CMO55_21945 [Verrucomicrobiales bacterium]|nr:hypothetical protein [Verrucomicrobiales bacterium]